MRATGSCGAGGAWPGRRLCQRAPVRLPEELRAVVILRYFAGYTQAETARALNIPQGTAATRQRRALQLLRLELGEEGDA